ncbi:DUF3961 domain-containing protein [Bacillus altitudinis]|uniref:DUF3961 domain-containing protein n=1 Tax=Bacillus altitudinis TaxID=293387 RepID=UPI00210071D2|nr:DUF3961 domain-containing protein [Bacillus altitudinis]UTV34848.1 DUF3961 domain-containing protein [Bacillus altitudinis]
MKEAIIQQHNARVQASRIDLNPAEKVQECEKGISNYFNLTSLSDKVWFYGFFGICLAVLLLVIVPAIVSLRVIG